MSPKKSWINPGLLLVALAFLLLGCAPALTYSSDSAKLVIFANARIIPGAPREGETCNLIPDLRLWGDGQIVYVRYEGGQRRVYSGVLNPSQIKALLEFLQQRGFFWPHTPETANPAGTFHNIDVYLTAGRYFYGDPGYYNEFLKSIDIAQLTEFIPQNALLVSAPYFGSQPANGLPEWPAQFSFSIDQADKGRWISGDALAFIWKSINDPWSWAPGFRDQGKVYSIALEIPHISSVEPPYDCWSGLKSILPTRTPTPLPFGQTQAPYPGPPIFPTTTPYEYPPVIPTIAPDPYPAAQNNR